MQDIINFFSHPLFIIIGGSFSLMAILGLLTTVYWVSKGIFPIWWKLGFSLSKRKIAIFADGKFNELKDILIDSGIFKEKNIIKIDNTVIRKGEEASFFIVHYAPYKGDIDKIISIKKDAYAMIIYAPQDEVRITKEDINKLNSQRNTIVVNFRGRLINDVLVSMMTTNITK